MIGCSRVTARAFRNHALSVSIHISCLNSICFRSIKQQAWTKGRESILLSNRLGKLIGQITDNVRSVTFLITVN